MVKPIWKRMQMKTLDMHRNNLIVRYARSELPSTMPNTETLLKGSDREVCAL
jgi:hypothetical protein